MIAPRPRGAAELLADRNPVLFDSLERMLFATNGQGKLRMERRATTRVMKEVVCEEKCGRRRGYRLTWDLSTFGLSTRTGPLHPVGTRLQVALHLPDDLTGPILFSAEVVGVNRETGGMRLAFRNPASSAVRRLHRFLFNEGESEAA